MLALTKPEKKILFAVFSILTAMCTMAYFAHRYSQRLIASAEKIEQSEEYKYHLQEVRSIIMDMETGVRGYVLTGDETYMAPTNQAISNLFLHLHELEVRNGLTPEQSEQIAQLKKLADEKSTLTERMAELRRQKGMEEAIATLSQGNEKNLMNQITQLSTSMMAKEDAHLAELKKDNRSSVFHFATTFYLLLLKISITVITVICLFVLYFRRRNKAEKLLKENQDLFYNVLDHTSSLISIKDLSGRFILINKAYEKLLHVPRDTVKGNTAYDLFDKAIADKIRSTDLEVIKQQQQIKVDEVVQEHGETIHFESLKFPLFDTNKIPYAICSISTDETEKIKSDQQHKAEMHRILDLFNNAPCGYQSTDKDGIIIEINQTLLSWLGYKRSEVVGKMPVRNFISPESLHQFTYYFPKIKSGEINSVFDVEVNYLRKNGTKLPIIANSVASYDEDGNFLYTRTSVFDVSLRKQVEEMATNN